MVTPKDEPTHIGGKGRDDIDQMKSVESQRELTTEGEKRISNQKSGEKYLFFRKKQILEPSRVFFQVYLGKVSNYKAYFSNCMYLLS